MSNINKRDAISSSFRDPSGFLFRHDDDLYRQVNRIYSEHYDHLMQSGLYDDLSAAGLLITHREVELNGPHPETAYRVIQPDVVPFISYPCEWSFSQLRDAALATLAIARKALDFGMSLKDATAFNVQFLRGHPVLIDTLSFELYREGTPWVAYQQFCRHFLAPLSLMSYTDVRLSQLLRPFISGIPLDLASRLLPVRTRLKLSLLTHIHVHGSSQRWFSTKTIYVQKHHFGMNAFRGLLDSLESAVRRLKWGPAGSEWGEYYNDTNYTGDAFEEKKRIVGEYLDIAAPRMVWDLGGNTGVFSRIASARGIPTICFDIDPDAVEKNYRRVVATGEETLLPLLMDLTNPSSGRGWHNRERSGMLDRGPVDTGMALALIHHLAISNNVPLKMLAQFLSDACRTLIIEFVPKSDSQVQRLLATREDIFPDYRHECFEKEFASYFDIVQSTQVKGSERTLYLMRCRN